MGMWYRHFCMIAILQGWFHQLSVIIVLLLVLGFVTNANVIVFSYLGKYFSAQSRTTVQGTTNMFNMGGGPVLQILVGWYISYEANGALNQLSVDYMQRPLWLIPISLMIVFFLLSLSRVHQVKG